MATKKPAATGSAVALKKANNVVDIRAQLAKEIQENKDYILKVENDEVVVSNKEEKVKKTRKKKE